MTEHAPSQVQLDLMATLCGPRIRLRPLQSSDAAALVAAAEDGALWNSPYTVIPSPATVDDYLAQALAGRARGDMMPLATERVDTGELIGTTRFWKIDPHNRRLEIGGTWLARRWQRSHANTEAKFLMLQHAFEHWQMIRVQFTTDELNQVSRQAILRLGAQAEGLIRYERIMPDGRFRNSLRFSILCDEWPQVCARLQQALNSPR